MVLSIIILTKNRLKKKNAFHKLTKRQLTPIFKKSSVNRKTTWLLRDKNLPTELEKTKSNFSNNLEFKGYIKEPIALRESEERYLVKRTHPTNPQGIEKCKKPSPSKKKERKKDKMFKWVISVFSPTKKKKKKKKKTITENLLLTLK